MSGLFDDLKQGLEEAIEYENGSGKAGARTLTIAPLREFTNIEIRQARIDSGMTQAVFAQYMGVSKKTVEAWECGRTHPTGPANRLLDILVSGKAEKLELIQAG